MNHEPAPFVENEEETSSTDLIGLKAELRKLKKRINDIEKKK